MVTAIVLAAGVGSRMQTEVAKQFLKIDGYEVLYYSLQVFQKHSMVDEIILVTKPEFMDYCQKEIVDRYGITKVSRICAGGKERYDSVYCGLRTLTEAACDTKRSNDSDKTANLVMIHDGARPFVTEDMITRSILCAQEYGACTVGVPAKDTIKVVDENRFGVETPERRKIFQIQTPQTFQLELLEASYKKMFSDMDAGTCTHKITDDTMLVEQYSGVRCKVVDGAYENIKITTPEDLDIATIFARKIFEKN